LPKIGFKNPNRVAYVALNLKDLVAIAEKYDVSTIDIDFLVASHIVRKNDLVKILANGELNTALSVSAHAASEKAVEAIQSKGGSFTLLK
jgi:large subunit ribosomal protein L15